MIFVTGGTGLVGSHLLMRLLEEGEEIKAIYRNKKSLEIFDKMEKWYQKPKGFFDKINWVEGSFKKEFELNQLMVGIETVFHCAALVSFQPRDKYALEEVNIFGTKHLVDISIANGVKEFYHVSSTAAIGKPKDKTQLISENILWKKTRNTSNYSISKHFAELEVWRGFEEGLNGAIVNPAIIIGPGNWGKSSTSLFETVNKGLNFYTTGANGFVDVRDVAEGLMIAYKRKLQNERVLLIAENLTYKEAFSKIAKSINKDAPATNANKFLSGIAWRVLWLWSLISGKDVPVTQETAHSANSNNLYNNKKSKDILGLKYHTIDEAIKHTGKCFQA